MYTGVHSDVSRESYSFEVTFPGYIQMYTGVHSDVSRESYSFELFDLPLDVPLVREINQGYMAYVYLWIPLI